MNKIKLKETLTGYAAEEAIKTLRTNLQFCGEEKRVILVTSCVPEEGKTTVALKLARSLCELQKRVLLIDADLRKSVLPTRLQEGTVEYGLSHFLSGQNTLAEVVARTDIPNLHILFAGAGVPNATELLSGTKMEQMVTQLRSVYDYIIVDSAPLGLVIDAVILAQYCDGAVLIIEEGKIRYKMAQEVKKKLDRSGCPVLGVVLNKASMKRQHGYYQEEYKHYRYE